VRKLGITIVGGAAAAAVIVSPALAHIHESDDAGAPMRATMTCERVDGPGRVRCDVEARVEAGEAIAWGDVVIVRTPPFVGALRGRIGPHDATAHEPDVWRWALALVARERGAGEVEARVRLVVCRADKCAPRETLVAGRVVAGN
jgi:hypothetical protein